jgi:signal transduction histidine kinase
MQPAMRSSLEYVDGVADRQILLISTDGSVMAQAVRPGALSIEEIKAIVENSNRGSVAVDAQTRVVWRMLTVNRQEIGKIIAELDFAEIHQTKREVETFVSIATMFLAGLAGLAAFVITRWLLRPITSLTSHLEAAGAGRAQLIDIKSVPAAHREIANSLRAYNGMVEGLRERDRERRLHHERERSAVLGHLAATVAHEVRNPINGMVNAVQTLRRFGDRRDVREEAIGFLERGLEALLRVVDVTLDTYRDRNLSRAFSERDIEDLLTLARADARRRAVSIKSEVEFEIPSQVDAGEVRHVTLNLLINAVRMAKSDGVVRLSVQCTPKGLGIAVDDDGPGWPSPDLIESGDGLGLSAVRSTVGRLGGTLALERSDLGGARASIHIPAGHAA